MCVESESHQVVPDDHCKHLRKAKPVFRRCHMKCSVRYVILDRKPVVCRECSTIRVNISLLCITFHLVFTYLAKCHTIRRLCYICLCSTNYRVFCMHVHNYMTFISITSKLKIEEMVRKWFEPTTTKLSLTDAMPLRILSWGQFLLIYSIKYTSVVIFS